MKKWEYSILHVGDKDDWIELQEKINEIGAEGYELVIVAKDLHVKKLERYLYIFKKLIE